MRKKKAAGGAPLLWPDARPFEEFETTAGCYRVTSCRIYPILPLSGKTRALVGMVLGDQLQLTAMRIVDGANGLFLSPPNDPSYKGDEYRSLYYGLTKELRDHMETVAVHHYIINGGRFYLENDGGATLLWKDQAGFVYLGDGSDKPLQADDLPKILAAYWRPEDKDAQSELLGSLAKKNNFL